MPPFFSRLPPLLLYVHLPWCVGKWPYGDSKSHEHGTALPEDEYVAALLRDTESALLAAQGRELQTIFIGGGTPTCSRAPRAWWTRS